MVMFSQLRRCDLTDDKGRQAKLLDLGVALLDADYPLVTRLCFLDVNKQKHSLPWEHVQGIDLKTGRIRVRDLRVSHKLESDLVAKEVFLGDHILDALVLDLQNRRVTRANDLWLEEDNNQLSLRAADTSFSAILRRLSGGLYRHISRSALYDWKYVEFLRGEPHAVRNGEGYHLRAAW
jgi:hypothetical protein